MRHTNGTGRKQNTATQAAQGANQAKPITCDDYEKAARNGETSARRGFAIFRHISALIGELRC
jgi:hypothetical protein